jgi:hypothetical protein
MSLTTIKKKNREFAKWWDRWILSVQRRRMAPNTARADRAQDQNSPELPHAIKILRRLQERY